MFLMAHFTNEEIKIANETSRTSKKPGAIGTKPVVVSFVEKIACFGDFILDFGAGKYPLHALQLKDKGFHVKAYEFGNNFDPKYHDENALSFKYDIVYASNVLNVQSSHSMLTNTLLQVKSAMRANSIFIANYPAAPRKLNLSKKEIKSILLESFYVNELGKNTMMMRLL